MRRRAKFFNWVRCHAIFPAPARIRSIEPPVLVGVEHRRQRIEVAVIGIGGPAGEGDLVGLVEMPFGPKPPPAARSITRSPSPAPTQAVCSLAASPSR